MSVAKVIEISAGSEKSFEDAINMGLERANRTVDNIEGAWVNEMKVVTRKGRVREYRVNLKLSFVLQ